MNEKFMARAIELSIKSVEKGTGPFGACVVKDNKIISGDSEKVKKVYDTWKFSKDSRSQKTNWLLIDTQA